MGIVTRAMIAQYDVVQLTSIPIQEFCAKLQEACRSNAVFISRFEDDDTGAVEDASAFSGCMHDMFGIGILQFIAENGRQKSLWNMIYEPRLASTDDSLQNVDVLAVLDCCYSGSAVRTGGNRSVQLLLLAACDDRIAVRLRKDGVTFTQRFRRAAHALQNAGNVLVSVGALFSGMQRSKPPTAPDTVHNVIGTALPSGNETTVLFKICLAGGPHDVILSEFQQLTKTIPGEFKMTRFPSTLDCVFIASVKGASLVHCKILYISI
ncbi:uncharacterized protein V1513DRAFT_461002 [Lipomyces chichibuensis]|uniref:uncharacterized protein n=1 Tax=Lipomyces chichibuensis TaxID=1546026 RepID=UPI0033441CD1